MKVSPMANPKKGDSTMASRTARSPLSLTVSHPPCVTAAPTKPPMSACEELVGSPNSKVNKFHRMAPANAAATIC